MKIQNITDASFRAYGKVLTGYDFTELFEEMKRTDRPADDVIYVPSDDKMEELSVVGELKKRGYGGLPIQVGYCNGHNKKLNAVEYHRSSEIDIAVDDVVLLLGKQQDIAEDNTYDTANIEAFLVPTGTAVELYATTLHYAPCTAGENEGFRCVIVLPKETNLGLDFEVEKEGEFGLLTAKNKWLIAHEDAQIAGAFCGLKGENITLS